MDSPLRFLPLLKQFVNKTSAFIWAVTFLLIPPVQLVAETFVPVGVGGIVTIIPVAPVATEDNFSMDEDTTAALDVLLNDSEQHKSQFNKLCTTQPYQHCFSISQVFPSQSSVAVEGNKLAVTPPKDWHGNAYFHYRLYDGKSRASKQAKVIVKVNPVNDAPVLGEDTGVIRTGNGCSLEGLKNNFKACELVVDVLANDFDIDGDQLTITRTIGDRPNAPQHAENANLNIINNKIQVLPTSEIFNNDADKKHLTERIVFSYIVKDGQGNKEYGSRFVILTIDRSGLKAPVITSALPNVSLKPENANFNFQVHVQDVDTPDWMIKLTAQSSNDALVTCNKTVCSGVNIKDVSGNENLRAVEVKPNRAALGRTLITLTATDRSGLSTSKSFEYAIIPGKPPVISHIADQLVKRNGNLQLAFTVSDADTSSDKLVVSASSSNTSVLAAAVPVTGGNGQYQLNLKPLPNVEGETIVTVKASDNPQGINVSTFQFKVKVAASPVIKQRFDWSAASVGVGQAVTLNYHFTEVVSCTDEKGASVKELPSYPELKGSRLMTFYQQSGSAQLVLNWRCKNQAGREFEFNSTPLTVNKLKAPAGFQVKQ